MDGLIYRLDQNLNGKVNSKLSFFQVFFAKISSCKSTVLILMFVCMLHIFHPLYVTRIVRMYTINPQTLVHSDVCTTYTYSCIERNYRHPFCYVATTILHVYCHKVRCMIFEWQCFHSAEQEMSKMN